MGGIVINKSIANTLINNKLTSMAASGANLFAAAVGPGGVIGFGNPTSTTSGAELLKIQQAVAVKPPSA